MWGLTKWDLLKGYFYIGTAVIVGIVAVVVLAGMLAKDAPQAPAAAVVEGELQLPVYTTFTTPNLETGKSETVSAVIVVVIMPKSLKKFVWLQEREAYDRKYEAVAKAGGKARVTFTPGAEFQGLKLDGIVVDIVPAR